MLEFIGQDWEVFVLAPCLVTTDETLLYYYDFSQSIEEFTKAFKTLGVKFSWQQVTVVNYRNAIDKISAKQNANQIIVLNLCDGDEINEVPGIGVVRHLERSGLFFTGSRESFYDLTTCKMRMKKAFDRARVQTPPWEPIVNDTRAASVFENLKPPLIVKPAISAGSMGISTKSVVQNEEELHRQLDVLRKGCHGWDTVKGGVFVEHFITGREFTTFIVGDANHASQAVVYAPVERVFDAALPARERFLSFDRLWEFYESETPLPMQRSFYVYEPVGKELSERIKAVSWDAYKAVDGTGYARVDLRMDEATQTLYVLEVNAQCGISEDEDFTSIGAILRFEEKSFTDLLAQILLHAIQKRN